MSDERSHDSPLDKLHLPWKRHGKDEDSDDSEKETLKDKLMPWKRNDKDDDSEGSDGKESLKDKLMPWKRHDKDDDSIASEKDPLVNPSTPTPTSTAAATTPVATTSPATTPSSYDKKKKKKQVLDSYASANVRTARMWDVKMPPAKKTMVHGMLVPTMGGTLGSKLIQKRRRIVIEIHSNNDTLDDDEQASSTLLRGSSLENVPGAENEHALSVDDRVAVRILKPESKGEDSSDEEGEVDYQTVSTIGFHDAADEESDVWVTHYVLGLDDVQILKSRGSHCEMKLGHGSDTQVRNVNFANDKDVKSFREVLDKLFDLKHKLTEQRVRDFCQLTPVSEDGRLKISLLVEIVSGIGLPRTDVNTTDAYVIVRLGGSQEVHRTTPIYGTLNPIWTIESGSLFILSVTPEAFFGSAQGLSFIVKDYDRVSANDTLGKVFVSQEELLKGEGEREEHDLLESASENPKQPGKLVLRYRKATEQDEIFMERLKNNQKNNVTGVYEDETFVPPHVSSGKFLHREHRKAGTEIQYRVKPGPDPDRPIQATKWMTTSEIDNESLRPSTKWIEAGSGDLGKLFVEIIGCDDLPNMDTKVAGGGKTDAFVSLVYEDSIVNSEVINDVLSPRWMPWTQRAFIFNVMHPSNDLMVGVLDYDSPAPLAEHDPIARCEVDITNLRPSIAYTLYYDLYTSALVKKRKKKGRIKIRVRLELADARKALIAGMKPPPEIFVNVATYRDYRVALFVVEGKYDVHAFNMNLFAEYAEELQSTGLALIPIMKNAAYTVVFWRGHYPLGLRVFRCPPLPAGDDISFWNRYTKSITILLPLHSVVAFVGAALLVEDYNLFPSFLLFAVGWLFLATSGHIRDNPSPWRHTRSFQELISTFVANSSSPLTIEPNQNLEEVQEYVAKKEEAEKRLKEEAEKRAKQEEKSRDAVGHLESAQDGAEVDMRTQTGGLGVSVNPLKPILYPMQINLQLACRVVRICRSFVVWEESYYCFWIVIGSIVGGLVLLFIPWGLLVRWTLRIAVWTLLGPWMKLVDIFYMKRVQSSEEEEKAAEARMKARYEALMDAARHTQTRREDLTKLKDMKRYMFGKFIAPIPRFKQQRYLDLPLAPSYASPHVSGETYNISCCKYGQHLTGDMIPKREIDESTEASPLQDAKAVKGYGTIATGTF